MFNIKQIAVFLFKVFYTRLRCYNQNFHYKKFLLYISQLFLFCLFSLSNLLCTANNLIHHKEITILLPQEHEALNQIVLGIKESLQDPNIKIIVKNAHGDTSILSSLIMQAKNNSELLLPIGTSTCQTTISHAKGNKIICVASSPIPNLQPNLQVTGINDEVLSNKLLSNLPKLTNIAIIYSTSEKIAPEIERIKQHASSKNLKLNLRMISSLIELPLILNSVSNDIEAFFILKDHLVVSGIDIIIKEANKRNIPIIASDEGSVIKGATIAIGVREKEIGIKAGELVKEILNGVNPNEIQFQEMNELSVFINLETFKNQNILTNLDIDNISLPKIEIIK